MGALDPPELGATPLYCDLCFSKIKELGLNFILIEDKAVCDPCFTRWTEEEAESTVVNRTIRLVPRGFYAAGRTNPGTNPSQ